MTDSTMADRLAALRADIAAAGPEAAAREAAQRVKAAAARDLADAGAWVRAHPLAAVGVCLALGFVIGGLWKRGGGQ
ncbi:hypothetical protein V5F53_16350 [Xanthobacter sp. V4C-4]|uniref:hypothetical protein n=1 Tax=Xanthobacter cornucopiae TaxID=3119924 RepID=UPI003726F4FA